MVSFRDITETFREVVKSQANSLSLSAVSPFFLLRKWISMSESGTEEKAILYAGPSEESFGKFNFATPVESFAI